MHYFTRGITSIMLRGLATFIPIAVTVCFLFWLLNILESTTQKVAVLVLPEGAYFTGLGSLMLLAVIFLLGIAMCEVHTEQIFRYFEKHFERIPVVKSVYGISRDFMDYFARKNKNDDFKQVASVDFPELGFKMVGFVTRENLSDESEALESPSSVLVYLPMGYQIGGFSIVVERHRVETLDMNFEDAMRFILSAGISKEDHDEQPAEAQ